MGQLFIITGPSGAGKREVLARAKQFGLKMTEVVSYTTRERREHEVDNEGYHFVSREVFQGMIDRQELAEWTEVHGKLLGSKQSDLDQALKTSPAVIIEVDPRGARKLKEARPNAVTIFIMPPSYEQLKKRLGTHLPEESKRRIEVGKQELHNLLDWDYLVVFDDAKLDQAAEDTLKIIKDHL